MSTNTKWEIESKIEENKETVQAQEPLKSLKSQNDKISKSSIQSVEIGGNLKKLMESKSELTAVVSLAHPSF